MCWGFFVYNNRSYAVLFNAILDPAGMELSFFRAACMGLWFRSATKTMLPTEPCFCCGWAVCRASRPSLFRTLPSQWVELGVRRVGRGHNWAGDPSWPERYSMPCNIMLSNEEGEEGELREAAIFCSGAGWVSIYPWEVVSGCLCVTCVALCSSRSTSSPIKHFIPTLKFSCFYYSFPFTWSY